jgi:prophage regulatory protein
MSAPAVTVTIQPISLAREHAAAALGISERTLEGLVREGKLKPPRKLSSGRVGWLYRELVEYAEACPISDLAPGPGRRAAQGGQPGA